MNLVAIIKDDNTLFQSQSYETEEQKDIICNMFKRDAKSIGVEIDIIEMTDEQLGDLI